MIQMCTASLLLLLVLSPLFPTVVWPAQSTHDICLAKVPKTLAKLLLKRYPNYRLPLASDGDQDEVSYNRNNDGDGCILVARGDYDGDHKQDVALILTKKKGDGTLLIAALRRSEEWDIAELPSWCGPIGRRFVMSSRPGTYKMTESFDYTTLHPDSREEMTTTTEVIYSGKTESSGIAYGLIGKKWVHVWVSD